MIQGQCPQALADRRMNDAIAERHDGFKNMRFSDSIRTFSRIPTSLAPLAPFHTGLLLVARKALMSSEAKA